MPQREIEGIGGAQWALVKGLILEHCMLKTIIKYLWNLVVYSDSIKNNKEIIKLGSMRLFF